MVHTGTVTTEKKKETSNITMVEEIGAIGDRGIRLDYFSWKKGSGVPKYEIRQWSDGAPYKGIGLTGEELIALGNLINQLMTEPAEEKTPQVKGARRSRKEA